MKRRFSVFLILLSVTFAAGAQKEWRIAGDTWYGCTAKSEHSRLTSYLVQNDQAAFKQALIASMLDGKCTAFDSGDRVFITDTATLSGLVKVRRKGQTVEFWTNTEALER